MTQVYIATNPTEAHFIKGLLKTQHIESFIKGETLFSIRGELPITTETAPSVWIFDDNRFDEAKTIIREYEKTMNQQSTDENNWICESCGEKHESQFTACWNCGKLK